MDAPPDLDHEPPRAAVVRVGRALLALVATFVPDAGIAFVLGLMGLVVGLVSGVHATAELLSGPGAWARAGPIALVLPLLTFLGPPVLGLALGVFVPLPLVLAVHAAVLVPFTRRDRHWVVFATAIGYWLPLPFGALAAGSGERATSAFSAVVVGGPFVAGLGFFLAMVWLAARLVLRGRSFAAFWRGAGTSMLVSSAMLAAFGVGVMWFVVVAFPLLPFAPLALLVAMAFAARLVAVGRSRGWAVALFALSALHLALLAAAIFGSRSR